MDENLNDLIDNCFKPGRTFRFSSLSDLTLLVMENQNMLFPVKIGYVPDMFTMTCLVDEPADSVIPELIRESDFEFLEVTEKYLDLLRSGSEKSPFVDANGADQFFYYDVQKKKLFLISARKQA